MGDMVWGPPHQTRPFGWKGPHTARRPQVDGLFFLGPATGVRPGSAKEKAGCVSSPLETEKTINLFDQAA